MREKYIKLLLEKCVNFNKSKSLFINYEKMHQDFVNDLVIYAKKMGVEDIYLDEIDSYYRHEVLKNIDIKDIEKHPLFNNPKWNEYALKNASFIMLDTEIPGLMEDIPSEKIATLSKTSRKSKEIYKEKQLKNIIPWTIACLPNEVWAKDMFPDSNDAYSQLKDNIIKVCMLDKENPTESWNEFITKNKEIISKLNSMKIKNLHYTNDLGTDLTVYLSESAIWSGADAGGFIANMPSYEVFTSPIYNKTNGIVYSAKPLMYNGNKINDFYVKFENGKVIDYDAKEGKNILKEIIELDEHSSFLGEIALVNHNSPISNTGLVFGTTLIDENASCHLALGEGFAECIKDGLNKDNKQLLDMGINISNSHVDFMIGTKDLNISGITYDNRQVEIFKDGNFSKNL